MSTKSRRAFITGVYGQDGSYLAEYLLENGYEVLGLTHVNDTESPQVTLLNDQEGFTICVGDLCALESYKDALTVFLPDEVYNIASISDLKTARENPELTLRVNFTAFLNLVAYVTELNPQVRIFQALSSRILTADPNGVISEDSPLAEPKNAYDEAKRKAYEDVVLPYRKNGFFIASGFLCNHESPRRGNRFVTGKIAEQVALISKGKAEVLRVGNVEAKRDWSYAGDFVRAMHLILALDTPDDFVIGSATLKSVRNFIDEAFKVIGISLVWKEEGVKSEAYDENETLRVVVDPAFYQTDDNPVVSKTTKLEQATGWVREVSFEALVSAMVEAERKRL